MEEKTLEQLKKLREPFPPDKILKKPRATKEQNNCPASEKKHCEICGGWHHPNVIHLDYVGHAALTDRLLDVDPLWTWRPLALKDGLPAFDTNGGLWIELTICGHTRLGYGNAESSTFKAVGDREKEVIGDALRNAAMRFGAALELWHKGDLHSKDPIGEDVQEEKPKEPKSNIPETPKITDRERAKIALEKISILFDEFFDTRGVKAELHAKIKTALSRHVFNTVSATEINKLGFPILEAAEKRFKSIFYEKKNTPERILVGEIIEPKTDDVPDLFEGE